MFIAVLDIASVSGSGSVHIMEDGSINPTTAPISTVDKVTYTFTGSIFDSVIVERDNIIVDGGGYTVQGPGPILTQTRVGITLEGRSNVTLKNIEIRAFELGVSLSRCSNITIDECITTETYGTAIYLTDSYNNTISENQIYANDWDSILVQGASVGNTISRNNITDNEMGIRLLGGSGNYLLGNNIIENYEGLEISGDNFLRRNAIADNKMNFGTYIDFVEPYQVSDFVSDVDLSNTVNGKPILYIVNKNNMNISLRTHSQVGYIAIVNSTNITVEDLKMENRNLQGILLAYSTNSTIKNMTLTNNFIGLVTCSSSGNRILENNVTANDEEGMLFGQSYNNRIFRNIVKANGGSGIKMHSSWNNILSGNNINANAYAGIYLEVSSNNNVIDNIVTATDGCGILLDGVSGNSVLGNNVTNNKVGIELNWAMLNTFHHNNFIGNTIQARKEAAEDFFANAWDAGYPYGGNYWSDYYGIDMEHGPSQDQLGADGIGDTPYVIDGSNKDNYPFMGPLGPDLIPPVTIQNHDGLWHTANFTITLTASDVWSGIADTNYRIDNDAVATVSTDGQPVITTESVNGTLEYWSVDNAGNEEVHHILIDIKLDKTDPLGSVAINDNSNYTTTTSAILSLSAVDEVSGVAEMRFSDDNVTYTEWQSYTSRKNWTLQKGDGTKSVYVQFKDKAGRISTCSDTIILDATKPVANAGQDQTVNVGTTVAFDASGSTDNTGIVSYDWDFGEGTNGKGEMITHEYKNVGTYIVALTVSDEAGNTGVTQIKITILPKGISTWIIGVIIAAIILPIGLAIIARRRRR